MRINKKYFHPNWEQLKEYLKENSKDMPPGYKFKKNELKGLFRKVVGKYRADFKNRKRGEKNGNE